jgi:O-antigen/teichoic acid export membrane protein
LILAALAVFYLTFADRYLLQIYTDTSQVGIYSLGYKFGFLLLLFAWGPFAAVWDAQRYSIAKKASAVREFNVLFTLVSTALIGFALCIGIFVRDLLMIMSDPGFWAASGVAHIIVIAYVFQAWTAFTNLGILISGRTIHMAFATGLACVVMTLAGLILIPRFGATGAATAVLSGFVVRFFWVYHIAKRHYDMKLEWGKVLKIAALALAVYGTALMAPDDIAASLTLHVVEAVAFFVLLLTLPILTVGERDRIIELVKNLRGRRPVVSGAD